MKNINAKQLLPILVAFLVGTVMGDFLIGLAITILIVAVVGYVAYVAYDLNKKGAFKK